ncbi:glucose/sorbosone dehydrogenase [Solibacillus silvestris StLB046]|uniref:Glucose/sorbosone dehydrogenase n=1 Tax=Solibacillus silvestris (strain StLB046) TaxID=1002809 RepID=F2F5F8_SOLSS|nr:sorbosone dehydrogenase family protein [Solibacillus silvestris]BAK14741.1 glucose/sorbosone dehydrogenase [Solibacillus silvestris StLB046]
MKKSFVGVGITLLCLTECSTNEIQPSTVANNSQSIEQYKTIATNLEAPWAINKLGDTFYITERTGHIVKVEQGEMTRQAVKLEKTLSTASEAGLLGFVLAPDFVQSNEAYAYYTYETASEQYNRIVVLQQENDSWREKRLLLDQIPSGKYHHGGRVKIGPDQKLYVTAGDASNPQTAQDLTTLSGKILRMNLDGSIPDDNPFPHLYVYSYGHRNPQGITWSTDGTMYASEHGQSAHDEINKIEAGQNYGWPIIEGEEEQEGFISPLFTSGSESTWAPSGIAFYDNKLYVAALRGTALLEFDLKSKEVKEIVNNVGRIRDVWIEENTLYWITNNTDGRGTPEEKDDQLYKLEL